MGAASSGAGPGGERMKGEMGNPISPLALSWLNLEHRGSARVFFHLKLNLFPLVLHCALQGSGSCCLGLLGGSAKQFPTQFPFATSFLPISPT